MDKTFTAAIAIGFMVPVLTAAPWTQTGTMTFLLHDEDGYDDRSADGAVGNRHGRAGGVACKPG